MKIVINPPAADWASLLQRPAKDFRALEASVGEIMQAVRQQGDAALRDYTARFDGVTVEQFKVPEAQMQAAVEQLAAPLKAAMETAIENIKRFHRSQLSEIVKVATMPGVVCWRKSVGIDKVGLYIPGGSAPLFSSVLMLAIPAKLAGCSQIVLCSPPTAGGQIHPSILAAAQLCGITEVYAVGGAQAIAAMTFGTESIPAVYKIFGPGNAYVTVAKQLAVQEGVAIDMPAGPSEVLVLADAGARADFVAIDLLSQAEHGPDSQVILLTYSEVQAKAILAALDRLLEQLPRREMTAKSIANSLAVVVQDEAAAAALINAYAPEHLILSMENALAFSEQIRNAGSVFLGYYTPESVGDYASGTNHTLPTYGYARQYSGVSVDSFVKKITFQALSQEGLQNIGPAVMEMAAAEQLEAHRLAVALRLTEQDPPAANEGK